MSFPPVSQEPHKEGHSMMPATSPGGAQWAVHQARHPQGPIRPTPYFTP